MRSVSQLISPTTLTPQSTFHRPPCRHLPGEKRFVQIVCGTTRLGLLQSRCGHREPWIMFMSSYISLIEWLGGGNPPLGGGCCSGPRGFGGSRDPGGRLGWGCHGLLPRHSRTLPGFGAGLGGPGFACSCLPGALGSRAHLGIALRMPRFVSSRPLVALGWGVHQLDGCLLRRNFPDHRCILR